METRTRQEIAEEYNLFYRANPLRWDNINRDIFSYETINLFLKSTNRKKPFLMLDIGCGSGHTLEFFSKQWNSTKFYGMDISDEVIHFAKNRIPDAEFIAGDLGKTEILEKFDVIIILGVLEHFENTISALKDIKKLLADDGILYVEVPNCIGYPESEKIESFRRLVIGSQQVEWHLYRHSWEERIRRAGFYISQVIKGDEPAWEFIWILTNKPEKFLIRFKKRILFEKYHAKRVRVPAAIKSVKKLLRPLKKQVHKLLKRNA